MAAGIGALVVGIALAVTAEWAWWVPVLLAMGAGGIGFAVAAAVLVADHRRLLWAAEGLVAMDIDGDGDVGRPELVDGVDGGQEEMESELRLAYVHDPRRRQRIESGRDLRYWLREAYGERGTTWRAWDGMALPSGRRMTRPLWERYTERMLKAGLAQRPYPTAELELVSEYRDALDAFREVL
jgi:hypothetical protein